MERNKTKSQPRVSAEKFSGKGSQRKNIEKKHYLALNSSRRGQRKKDRKIAKNDQKIAHLAFNLYHV